MKKSAVLAVLFSILALSITQAQEPPLATPQKEHEWLKQFEGSWETEGEALLGPETKLKYKGTIQSRSIGGFWMLSEMKSEMMGNQTVGIQTLGYDSATKKYVGTWIDSMLDYLWKYQGTVDESGTILTLEAEGPNFIQGGKTAKFRDVYEFKTKDQLSIKSMMQGEDGQWVTFMTGQAQRVKEPSTGK